MTPDPPRTLADYRDLHRGETVYVCGCGASLAGFRPPEGVVSIGVNDVGREFDPDYLVVLNPRTQFVGDRFSYVERSRARAIFTQLDLGLDHPCVVRFRLGRRGGAEIEGDPETLDYASNSPYVALLLALRMGAAEVRLIGVDFTEDHFFGPTGRHPLTRQLARIDAEYARLGAAARARGARIVNMSPISRLKAFPKLGEKPAPKPIRISGRRVSVQRAAGPVIGAFLDAFAESASAAGYAVDRLDGAGLASAERGRVVVCWNGRRLRAPGPAVFCEHGWLPRTEYQVSARGINAESHAAPFLWNGRAPEGHERDALEQRLAEVRGDGEFEAVEGLPKEFILAPLQIESDTNIVRHAPARYRSMQAFVDDLSRADPPLPVVFKQHPADARHGGRHLRLHLRRPQDLLLRHDAADIRQTLAGGRCLGVVSINSNVVHDALAWGVPSAVLGRNVWPPSGTGPFLFGLPANWDELFEYWASAQRRACRDAYALHLMRHQWTLADARDPARVARAVEEAASRPVVAWRTPVTATWPRVRRTAGLQPTINVVAANRGWLFEDLKRHLLAARFDEARVVMSERPRGDADAWIYLRAREAGSTPDPARTLVQIHDMAGEETYAEGGERAGVRACTGLVLTHPAQREILARAGVAVEDRVLLCRPLGALRHFTPAERPPAPFTVGWVGRPGRDPATDPKRAHWIAETLTRAPGARALLLGERLERVERELRAAGVEVEIHERRLNPIGAYPRRYHEMSCLLITDTVASGPNCLFEAWACGLPVVATPVGWAAELVREGENGYLADTPVGLAAALGRVGEQREEWFARRGRIRELSGGRSLESWVRENLELAMRLARPARRLAGVG